LRQAVAAGQPIVIVAFGSSSTEGIGASAPPRSYPARLEAVLRAAWPTVPVTVLNRGKGGQTVATMTTRLRSDVLAVNPTLVIWQVGANAALRAMDPQRFGAFVEAGVAAIRAAGADIVLMDNQLAPRIIASPRHQAYGEVLMQQAAAWHIPLFSRTALMREWVLADPQGEPMIGDDGLHHTDRGYGCLAQALAGSIIAAGAAPLPPVAGRAEGARTGMLPALPAVARGGRQETASLPDRR
jgi:lysophospholipase L1-like esterase